jgi:preprotein translocase subunit YajC
MSQSKIIGLVVLAIGGLLLFFAFRASQAPADQITEALTGRFTDNTMLYLIGGLVGVVAGIGLLMRGK